MRTARMKGIACLTCMMLTIASADAATSTDPWVFVSAPDWLNQDVADLSGATNGIPAAPGWARGASGGVNGVTPELISVYSSILGEMADHQPQAFLVAGDLINGRWFNEATLDMFDPATRNRETAIRNASAIYYGWYRGLSAGAGMPLILGAVGDHEIGDDPWLVNSEKARHIKAMKEAFHREMIEPLALPDTINGVASRYIGAGYGDVAYACRLNNVVFISVDVFRHEDSSTLLDAQGGTVRAEVSAAQLAWLEQVLQAADADPTIDHVIVQGHAPALSPVRMQASSGILVAERENSAFWTTLRAHDHRRGGKVRLYLAGEVHSVTTTVDRGSDLVQIAHGDAPVGSATAQSTQTNFVAFTIMPQRIEASLRWIELASDGHNVTWQVDRPATVNPIAAGPGIDAGALTIDTSGADSVVTASGLMGPVDMDGLAIHFGFDQMTLAGNFSNDGDIGDLYYEGRAKGQVKIGPGLFGNALQLNGVSGYVDSGTGNLHDGESRTISAWVQTSASAAQTILSYGSNVAGLNGRFQFLLNNGRLQLRISNTQVCLPGTMPGLHDGRWRHVAVVLSRQSGNRCADVRFYLDGVEYPAVVNTAAIQTLPWRDYRIGASRDSPAQYFNGRLDDVSIWSSALSRSRIKAAASAGIHIDLGYDAPVMRELFDLFDAQGPASVIAGARWQYATGLAGTGGGIRSVDGRIAIVLDESGNGLLSDIPMTPRVFRQSGATDGLLVMEAEHAAANTPRGVHRWAEISGTNYVGGLAMRALPNSNVTLNSGYGAASPRLDFEADFVHTGRHYIWVRGAAATSADASLHVGLDGVESVTADRMQGYMPWPSWRKSTLDGTRASVVIATPGRHIVNVWMRQDGIVVDRLLLTRNSTYAPTGSGPAESPWPQP